ncbi:DUF1801 domain-containing protein [Nocardioides sp. BGMRC 2183]|nr:DUF1801 domain-containing protein [Nocardioides sp. BGMRC 2183]
MPMPKRVDVDDYYDHLADAARPHMERLRELSLAADPEIEEKLAWNNPSYAKDGVRLWMLQAFKAHCSLRTTPEEFAPFQDRVLAAGYEAGEGFIKLPYDVELPDDLCTALMEFQLANHTG